MIMKQTAQTLAILVISIGMVISINVGTAAGAERQMQTIQPKLPVDSPAQPVKKAAIPSLSTLKLIVTVLNSAEIKLSWNILDCGGYRIDKKKGNAAYSTLTLPATGDTSFIDIQVSPTTSYTYRIFTRCGGNDLYSNEVTIATGDNNPYTETINCPQTVQKNTTTPNYGTWSGYSSNETVQLYAAYTQEGTMQRLNCSYKACSSCEMVIISRNAPVGSCKKTEINFEEKSFKCKKGAF
jgi:hypothetical protein